MLDRREVGTLVFVSLLAILGGLVAVQVLQPPQACSNPYEHATVSVIDANDSQLANVSVRIADTDCKRYVGLSRTESLSPDDGMLFVHSSAGPHAYVMRNMSFPLDIIFIDASGKITAIHHAPVPSATTGNELRQYRGSGRFVLEVQRGWANATGVDVGDRVVIPSSIDD